VTITLTINGKQVPAGDEAAINEQINRRRDDGAAICVHVRITGDGIDLSLGTPGCGGGGGGRQLSEPEQRLVDLWRRQGLSEDKFSGGNVVAFLQQLRRFA
jgi:hypothetical protein